MICVTLLRSVVGVRVLAEAVKPSSCAFDAGARMTSSCHWNVVLSTVSGAPMEVLNGTSVGSIFSMMSETSSFLPTTS
jgi:hypothetical protein